MNEPRWNDPSVEAGTMVRAALWLLQVVGVGNSFTKEQLRRAFPGVSQADRRVRDLRAFGWTLDTNASDVTLSADEQRFVKAGVAVWDEAARRKHASNFQSITAKQRAATLASDGYQCVSCGIGGGEAFLDNPSETAVLSVSRRTVELSDGSTELSLITECKRCSSGDPQRSYSVPETQRLIRELSNEDQARLKRWLERGRRGGTAVERAWNSLRALPSDAREQVKNEFLGRSQ